MKIKMLSSHAGSPDGIKVQWFVSGQVYDVTEAMAGVFLKEGWAVDANAPAPIQPPLAHKSKQEFARSKARQ